MYILLSVPTSALSTCALLFCYMTWFSFTEVKSLFWVDHNDGDDNIALYNNITSLFLLYYHLHGSSCNGSGLDAVGPEILKGTSLFFSAGKQSEKLPNWLTFLWKGKMMITEHVKFTQQFTLMIIISFRWLVFFSFYSLLVWLDSLAQFHLFYFYFGRKNSMGGWVFYLVILFRAFFILTIFPEMSSLSSM